MKFLIVGDLHLRERELSTTKGLVESSSQMLDGIIKVLEDDPEIKMVFFLGDIQHDTPRSKRTLRETTIWKSKLSRIGGIVSERTPKTIIVPRENEEEDLLNKKLPLFSLVGNHDIENKMKSAYVGYNYTFFDDLIYTGILQNPRGVLYKDGGTVYYVQLNNYGEAETPILDSIKELDENIKYIKLLHDTVVTPDSPSWMSLLGEDEYYLAEDILGDCDLAVCGHIHEPLPPITVQGNGELGTKEAIYIQTGSMGRTSMTDAHMRDYGFCTVVDTSEGIHTTELRIPLMSVENYYNWKQIRLNQNKKEAIKSGNMFKLDFGSVELTSNDPREDIRELEIEEDVKENCIQAINDADISDI